MQCQEDKGFCSGRKNLQCLSSTVYSSDFSKHLLFLCSFNNLGCLISFNTELHDSLIYEALTKYVICKCIFFHSISCHFILWMASFTMQKVLSLMWSHQFIFAVLPLPFDDWVVWAACILESNPLSVVLFAIIFLNSYQRHRLAEWIQKQDPYICCLQYNHFSPRDTYRPKVRGWKKIFHANGNWKFARLAILISEKNRPENQNYYQR